MHDAGVYGGTVRGNYELIKAQMLYSYYGSKYIPRDSPHPSMQVHGFECDRCLPLALSISARFTHSLSHTQKNVRLKILVISDIDFYSKIRF